MESVPKVVARKRGNATFAELVEATSRRALAAAVKAGQVERLARGIYVLPGADGDRRTALRYVAPQRGGRPSAAACTSCP